MYSGKLKVSEELYRERLDRMARLTKLQVPKCVIQCNALLLAECFQDTLWDRWQRWLIRQPREWLLWILSAEYRRCCRIYDAEFEKELQNLR